MSPAFFEKHRMNRMSKDLHLSPEQKASIRTIFEKAHERARQVNEEVSWDLSEIHRDSVQAIQQVLTPEQRQRFEQIRRRHAHRPPPMDHFGPPPGGPMPPPLDSNLEKVRADYRAAVAQYGADSPQALDARNHLRNARRTFRESR
jgi:hypothetical protein